MADVHDRETRRRNMQAIRSRDTKPEIQLRKALYRRGYRYRVCPVTVTGKPDLWLPKYNAAVFVHGCFWHAHHCHLFRLPKTRTDFWQQKLEGNAQRDKRQYRQLIQQNIRILIVWECALKGKHRLGTEMSALLTSVWLQSNEPFGEIDSRGLKLSLPENNT